MLAHRLPNIALALSATEAQIHSAAWGLPAMTWEERLDAEMTKLNSQFPVDAEFHAKPKPKPKPRPGC